MNVTLWWFGIEMMFVALDDIDVFVVAIMLRTWCLYIEIVVNPVGIVVDFEWLVEIVHVAGVLLVVDFMFALFYLCWLMDFGVDIVIHLVTKFLGGYGTLIGGVVVDFGEFLWDNGNFLVMIELVVTYGNLRFVDNFGEYGFVTKLCVEGLCNLGGVFLLFNVFLLL